MIMCFLCLSDPLGSTLEGKKSSEIYDVGYNIDWEKMILSRILVSIGAEKNYNKYLRRKTTPSIIYTPDHLHNVRAK